MSLTKRRFVAMTSAIAAAVYLPWRFAVGGATPRRYCVTTSDFGSNFVGLGREVAAVRRVAKEFKMFFQKVRLPSGDYTIDHRVPIYVLDKQARVRLMFTADRKLEDIAHDILNSHATP
jgi:cytochrome oxidase Cu insertion factor (SCO1/SenC/PrrC family)